MRSTKSENLIKYRIGLTRTRLIWKVTSGNLRQRKHEVVNVGPTSDGYDIVRRNLSAVVPVGDVFANVAGEQDRFLRHETNLRPQPADVQRFYVATVKELAHETDKKHRKISDVET